MIQRIQSIFLLLSSVGFLGLFGLPFATSGTSIPQLLADNVYNVQDSPILMALAGVGGLVCLGAIFLYNNRQLQIKLSYLSIVCAVLLILVTILLIYNERTITEHAESINDGFGIYLPVLSIVLSILAGRYIKKDENIVRSMDRLR